MVADRRIWIRNFKEEYLISKRDRFCKNIEGKNFEGIMDVWLFEYE